MKLAIRPLTSGRWKDLETLFGARGCSVARQCWCMFYRRSGALAALPRGMTRAAANRAELRALAASGEPPGLIAYARKRRVRLLEAYPVDRRGRSGDDAMWFGAKSMYDAAGFEEVARRKPQRPIVRLHPARDGAATGDVRT